MEKEEQSVKFPSNCVSYLSKSTASIAEFNKSGTLLAIGCKMGIILLMDMLTSRIVKSLSFFPDLEIKDWIFHGFEDFEEFDLLYLLKNLKASKLSQVETKQTNSKSKQSTIKHKDYMVSIESLQFSSDGSKLLVCYRSRGGSLKTDDAEAKAKADGDDSKSKSAIVTKIKEWDILKGEVYRECSHDLRISQAQYHPRNENIIVASGSLPYFITNFDKKECMINEEEYKTQIERIYDKDERWIVKSLNNKDKSSFVVFNKDYNIIAIIEECNPIERFDKEEIESIHLIRKEKYSLSHSEVKKIIESRDRGDEAEMDVDIADDAYKSFKKLFKDQRFNIKAYASISNEVTSLIVFHPNSLIIANCFDKILRLYDASDETLDALNNDLKISPFREFTDIVLKRKFAGGIFYKIPEDKDLYLLTGIEKAGELIAYSVRLGSQYARVGNWKEGCEYMAYFNNDMKNFMIVYITSMSSVVIWKKPVIKNFEALSPHFVHIEQNSIYISPQTEQDKEPEEVDYVEPKSSMKLKNCFKTRNKDKEIKSIPARLHLNDNVTEFCRDKQTLKIQS